MWESFGSKPALFSMAAFHAGSTASAIEPCKIALVGEAPGQSEELTGRPFVGSAGQELTRMLGDAGIVRSQCFLTNVFTKRPQDNKIENFCCSKLEIKAIVGPELYKHYKYPGLLANNYVRPEHLCELVRLKEELELVKPNLVVALGNTALWALCGVTGITKVRGTLVESSLVPGLKVLPTFHPANILREWSNRIVAVADLIKAKSEMEYAEIRRPRRTVHIAETLEDVHEIYKRLMQAERFAVDIETALPQITCIGFAPNKHVAYVIPLVDKRKPLYHAWQDPQEEIWVWNMIRNLLWSQIPKVFQNGMYDMQCLLSVGIAVNNPADDTMLLHHAMYPEMQKDLGFLGSVYTEEQSWKIMRPRGGKDDKQDE